jgi:hypothetical protein
VSETREAAIQQEAVNEEHRAALAASGQQMAASVERARAARAAAHEQARSAARAAKDRLGILVGEREAIENRIGYSRADLAEAQKRVDRCSPPSPDDYPTPSEIDAHKQRRGQLEEEVRRIAARIGTEQAALDAALHAEWEGRRTFEQAAEAELARRNEL